MQIEIPAPTLEQFDALRDSVSALALRVAALERPVPAPSPDPVPQPAPVPTPDPAPPHPDPAPVPVPEPLPEPDPAPSPAPEPQPDPVPIPTPPPGRAPLHLDMTLADGSALSFDQEAAGDIGDYVGPFVRQQCFRQRSGPWVVFFRPDADGRRDEVVIEYGSEVVCSTSPPVPARGATATHCGPYTAIISGGGLAAPVTIAVPGHVWGTRWRWQSAPRPIVRSYADLLAMRAILPLATALAFGVALPAPVAWKGPMDRGGLTLGMGQTGDLNEIGFVTEHQAAWLTVGGAAMESSIRAQAEAVGSMPCWARDVTTGMLVNKRDWPYIAYNDSAPFGPFALPAPKTIPAIPYFKMESAHLPDPAFVAWVLTDDPYFLESAQALTNFSALESNLSQRTHKIDCVGGAGQVRSWAWALRGAFRMAGFSPESVPAWLLPREYWQYFLSCYRTYAMKYLDAKTTPATTVFKLMTRTDMIRSFMLDFLVVTLAWAKWTEKFPEWDAVVDYASTPRMVMSDYTGASGWDGRMQVPYEVRVTDGRLGAAAPKDWQVTLFGVEANPNMPTSWAELWSCWCDYAAGGPASGKQQGWTDPSTWAPDAISPFQRNYLPATRAALAALALAGVPGARDRHDWLYARLGAKPGGAAWKWAVPAS